MVQILKHKLCQSSSHLLLSGRYALRQKKKSEAKGASPPVDLHWFFEISIRTEKKFQLELKKKFSYKLTEKKFQLVYN